MGNRCVHERDACCFPAKGYGSECGAYLVERIVATDRECVRFDGFLRISGLPAHLCAPLALCRIEVTDVSPCAQTDALQITALCFVEDARGCRAQGSACFQICAERAVYAGTCALRRGAKIRIVHAAMRQGCLFEVCLDVIIHTIVTRSECWHGPKEHCRQACEMPPLYPRLPQEAQAYCGCLRHQP